MECDHHVETDCLWPTKAISYANHYKHYDYTLSPLDPIRYFQFENNQAHPHDVKSCFYFSYFYSERILSHVFGNFP